MEGVSVIDTNRNFDYSLGPGSSSDTTNRESDSNIVEEIHGADVSILEISVDLQTIYPVDSLSISEQNSGEFPIPPSHCNHNHFNNAGNNLTLEVIGDFKFIAPDEGTPAAAALAANAALKVTKVTKSLYKLRGIKGRPKMKNLNIVKQLKKHTKRDRQKKHFSRNFKGKVIDAVHEMYTLTAGMMLGIRVVVGRSYSVNTDLSLDDFNYVEKLTFPAKGSTVPPFITPPHPLVHTFKFKSYAPRVFRRIRDFYGIDPENYMFSVCGDYNYIEFISNSKSGQFFFYSHDGKYMIKTQTKEENKFMRRILPHYFKYISQNPHSLLVRIYDMYRVKMYHLRRKVHFVIMGSVFDTPEQIHSIYDLKGSLVGREATPEERDNGGVLKDMDLINDGRKICLGEKKTAFMEQISKDAHFLATLNIMDYSLLLGIHDRKKRVPIELSPESTSLDAASADVNSASAQKQPPSRSLTPFRRASLGAGLPAQPTVSGTQAIQQTVEQHTTLNRGSIIVDAGAQGTHSPDKAPSRSLMNSLDLDLSDPIVNATTNKNSGRRHSSSAASSNNGSFGTKKDIHVENSPATAETGRTGVDIFRHDKCSHTDSKDLAILEQEELLSDLEIYQPRKTVEIEGETVLTIKTSPQKSIDKEKMVTAKRHNSMMKRDHKKHLAKTTLSSPCTTAAGSTSLGNSSNLGSPLKFNEAGDVVVTLEAVPSLDSSIADKLLPHSPCVELSLDAAEHRDYEVFTDGEYEYIDDEFEGSDLYGDEDLYSDSDASEMSDLPVMGDNSLIDNHGLVSQSEVIGKGALGYEGTSLSRLFRSKSAVSSSLEKLGVSARDSIAFGPENTKKHPWTTRKDLGINSRTPNGRGDEIYFCGVIDILQQYNTIKKFENFFKGFTNDRKQISSVDSETYANRFVKFLDDHIEGNGSGPLGILNSIGSSGRQVSLMSMGDDDFDVVARIDASQN